MGMTVTFGPFTSDAFTQAAPLPSGTVGFALFLGTGAAGMPGCADVAVTLTKEPSAGAPVTVGTTMLTAISLVPKGSITGPVTGAIAVAPGTGGVAAGDRLSLSIAVTNQCPDGAHSPRVLYDAVDRDSRITLSGGGECVDGDDTDGDGVGDACDGCPAVATADQIDADGDGLAMRATSVPRRPIPRRATRTATAWVMRATHVPTLQAPQRLPVRAGVVRGRRSVHGRLLQRRRRLRARPERGPPAGRVPAAAAPRPS
jgi:hypothetical protein